MSEKAIASPDSEVANTSTGQVTTSSNEPNEIDKLLNSGKITNAVDFYNYFKNKQLIDSNSTNTSQPHQQTPASTAGSKKRQKKSKTNLNDYVNIIQAPLQGQGLSQLKHNNSFNNGIPGNKIRYKKTYSSHNISNMTNNNSPTNQNLSLSSISIPDRQSPSPNSNQSTKNQFNKRTSLKQSNIPNTESIFNAYQITDSIDPSDDINDSSTNISNNLELPVEPNVEKLNEQSSVNTSPIPANDPNFATDYQHSNPQSLSSIFLKNSSTYYQKYQQQQQPIVQNYSSTSPIQTVYTNHGGGGYDRKKEEAINRIIRNEKIKQIRIKMYEYELLKDYGALNPQPLTISSDMQMDEVDSKNEFEDFQTNDKQSGVGSIKPYSFIPKPLKKSKNNKNKNNNSFSSYQQIDGTDNSENLQNNGEDSDSDDKSSMSSQTHRLNRSYGAATRSSTTFDEYKDGSYIKNYDDNREENDGYNEMYENTTNEDDDDDFLFSDEFSQKDDENYESGIEEDSCSKSEKSMKSNQTNKKGSTTKKVKPGFERYEFGSVNSFTLSAFAQSTFQLKCSIISAEVKNIVNVLKQAELEVSALQRRVQLIEEDLEKTEERLNQATSKLNEASQAADESERGRKSLETKSWIDDERSVSLEKQLIEAQIIAEEADRRYDEVARRIAIMEVDLERTEDRAEDAEAKVVQLEDELKVIGNNMKSLEISEQEAMQREESYEEQIRNCSAQLKDAEQRADLAERTMAKLQKEVDRLEDELGNERLKSKGLQYEMEKCIADLQSM